MKLPQKKCKPNWNKKKEKGLSELKITEKKFTDKTSKKNNGNQ